MGQRINLIDPSTACKHNYVWPGTKEPCEETPSLMYSNHTRSMRASDLLAKRAGAVHARVQLGLEHISQ